MEGWTHVSPVEPRTAPNAAPPPDQTLLMAFVGLPILPPILLWEERADRTEGVLQRPMHARGWEPWKGSEETISGEDSHWGRQFSGILQGPGGVSLSPHPWYPYLCACSFASYHLHFLASSGIVTRKLAEVKTSLVIWKPYENLAGSHFRLMGLPDITEPTDTGPLWGRGLAPSLPFY